MIFWKNYIDFVSFKRKIDNSTLRKDLQYTNTIQSRSYNTIKYGFLQEFVCQEEQQGFSCA